MLGNECPICGSQGTQSVAVLEGLPVFCNVQYPTREQALDQPLGVMDLHYCSECAHFFNAAFDPDLMRYGESYENSLHFSPTFSSFARDLAQDLVDRLGVRSSQVIDIGCGKGDFLKLICTIGDNEGHGFDPSYDSAREADQVPSNVSFNSRPFTRAEGEALDARLLTCRHVLEHIEQPVEFLHDIVVALKSAKEPLFYLEVPNSMYTVRDLGIWDLIYEHCQYFTANSFGELVRRAGLTPNRISETFGGQYLGLEAVRNNEQSQTLETTRRDAGYTQLAEKFDDQFTDLLARWQSELDDLTRQGPAVVWGAGSKGVTFVNLLQAGERIAAMVDVNPHKQNQYIAGTGHRIISPEDLLIISPASVLVMNPLYKDEIQTQIRAIGSDADVRSVT